VTPVDRSRRFALADGEGLAEGLTRIAAGRAEKALSRLALEPADADLADAVHGARKDLKKLRTVLRLLRDDLGGKRHRRADRRFRDAGRALSTSRDAEVKVVTLEALISASGELPSSAFAWRRQLELERDATAAPSPAVLAEAVEAVEAGLAEIDSWQIDGDGWGLIDDAVLRSYRCGRRAMRAAAGEPSEEGLHEWRKRAKDLWYEQRLLTAAWPPLLEAGAEEAHRLTSLLGDHQDLAVLRRDLAGRRFDPSSAAALEAAIAEREEGLAAEAFELGKRVYAESPKQFRRRLRRYWQAWRG
jgi:CHAD domain-containing protein